MNVRQRVVREVTSGSVTSITHWVRGDLRTAVPRVSVPLRGEVENWNTWRKLIWISEDFHN